MGPGRGLVLTGVLGGMASSTAVTLAMSRQVHRNPESQSLLLASAFAVLLANAFMFFRVTVAVGVVNFRLLSSLWVPFVAMAIPGSLVAGGMWYRLRRHARQRTTEDDEIDSAEELDLRNPFELKPALKFALLLIVIIGVANGLQMLFGSSATYLAALFGGLAETNAISLAMARMGRGGDVSSTVATRAIVVAILANSFVKAGLSAVIGSRKLGGYVAIGLIPILIAGAAAVLFI